MAKRLPVFESERDCLFEMLSWDDRISPAPEDMASRASLSGPPSAPATSSSIIAPASRLPRLPLEIWTAVISHLTRNPDDICSAWLSVRRVSRCFKAATEAAVSKQVLRSASISFPVHRTRTTRSENEWTRTKIKLGTIDTYFDRVSEDGERVFFRDKAPLDRMSEDVLTHTVRSWRRRIRSYLDQPPFDSLDLADNRAEAGVPGLQYNQPPYVIAMGGMVNDTELLGLEADIDRLEISFLWKPMLTMFFAEEERIRRLTRNAKVRPPIHPTSRAAVGA
jgi:hypothetical protein